MDKKVNVLMIMPSLNITGGIESFVMNYYKYIDHDIFHIDFISHDVRDNYYTDIIKNAGDSVFGLPKFGLKSIKKIVEAYRKIITEKQYQIVHCNMANAAFIYLKLAKDYNIPCRLLHSHQDKAADTFSHTVRNVPLILWGKRYSNVNLACSENAGNFLFGKKNYQIIRNCIDYNHYQYNSLARRILRKQFNLEGFFVIGHTGRLCKQKNQEFLLRIFKKYSESNNRAKLLLIGDGSDEKKLRNLANYLGIAKDVIFLGPRTDIPELLSCMDCFVFPSRYEGVGISVLEAQVNQLPVICSTGVPKSVDISSNIIHLNLNFGWKKWIQEIDRISQHARNGNVVISDKFDIRAQSKNLENLYYELCKEFKI